MRVLITGMHRSGTSLVARAFALSGFFLGERLAPADAFNTLGFFEDERLIEFHEELLAANGATWYSVRSLRHPLVVPSDLRERGRLLVREIYGDHEHWAMKEPRASLFLPLWRELVPDLRYVFVVRDPAFVVSSLMKRGDPLGEPRSTLRRGVRALELWRSYNTAIADFAERHPADSVFVLIPADAENGQTQLLKALDHWDGREIDLSRSLQRELLLSRPRNWIRVISALNPSNGRLSRRLLRLHSDLPISETMAGALLCRRRSPPPGR